MVRHKTAKRKMLNIMRGVLPYFTISTFERKRSLRGALLRVSPYIIYHERRMLRGSEMTIRDPTLLAAAN